MRNKSEDNCQHTCSTSVTWGSFLLSKDSASPSVDGIVVRSISGLKEGIPGEFNRAHELAVPRAVLLNIVGEPLLPY